MLGTLLLGAFLLTGPVLPGLAQAKKPFESHTYRNPAGQFMPYRLYVPSSLKEGETYPLVFFLHGAGERGNNNMAQLKHGARVFQGAQKDFPCFILAPQCPKGQQWVDMPWGADSGTRPAKMSRAMELALKCLDEVLKKHPVDAKRLYVTGLSMGGYGTWDCITRFPGRFAAAVPICGGGDEATVTRSVAKVPVWAFHSADDLVVKVHRTQKMIEAMKGKGGKPHYFEYQQLGHGSWVKAYGEKELLPWMFAQRLGKADTYALKRTQPELPPIARYPDERLLYGKGPLQKADWFLKLWADKRMTWLKRSRQDRKAVVFLGDSITQGWVGVQNDFPKIKVVNRGISGDVTRSLHYRMKRDVMDLEPEAVVLLIGTNDLGLGGKPEDAAENVKKILSDIQKLDRGVPVIVCKVMPRQEKFAKDIQTLNGIVDEFVEAHGQFIRCDTWSIFADEKGAARKEEFPDLLHPNGDGYEKWKRALAPIFENLSMDRAAPR